MIGDLRPLRTVVGELENTGTIEGRVFTYGGDDTYRAFADGALSGTVLGGSGAGAFTGTGRAEVLVLVISSGDSFVRVDVADDGARDLQILVEDVTGLRASDFVL